VPAALVNVLKCTRDVKQCVTNVATVQVPGSRNWETAMSLDESAAGNLHGNWRNLGTMWLVYGIYRAIVGICLVLFSGTATAMFGALLSRAADPFALMGDFHIIYVCIVVLTLLSGLLGLLAGLALLANRRSARMLALVASFLSVSEIPLGTTLGIYTLIVLLPVVRLSPPIRS
jgi:vacuolar-type H+-ATPase subunit I/STV1